MIIISLGLTIGAGRRRGALRLFPNQAINKSHKSLFRQLRVPMAMICIISAILYPFFTPARPTAGAALRLSNLKSIARAITVYDYYDLHDFGNFSGFYPIAGVTCDRAGNMYGTTYYGGGNYNPTAEVPFAPLGMVWEITTAGTYIDLHDFGGTVINASGNGGRDGTGPGTVTFDSAGNMYGPAGGGGANNGGMIWEITTSGTYKDLHDFGGTVTNANGQNGPDGFSPGAVTLDSAGNMYGVAGGGGVNDGGLVWEITASGTYNDLHDFGGTVTNADGTSGPDGQAPVGDVTFDRAGNIYGTTWGGGPHNVGGGEDSGMAWKITTDGSYKDLHDFGSRTVNTNGLYGQDGFDPSAGVTFDSAGDMFGTTQYGGANFGGAYSGGFNAGMLWEITAAGAYVDVHDFGNRVTNALELNGPDGLAPLAGVTFDSTGDMYGTAAYGGVGLETDNPFVSGMVWEVSTSPPSPPALTVTAGNAQVTLSWTASRTAGNYYVYRGTTAGGEASTPVKLGPATTYTDTSATNGFTYYYKLTAVNPIGTSQYSNEAATTPEPPLAPTPAISPDGGSFTGGRLVTITDSLNDVTIHYTTDGSTPTTDSPAYTGPITVSSSETISAIATASGYLDSAVTSAAFTISQPKQVPAPTISPNGGTFTGPQSVTITDSLSGAAVYYTTDNSTPTTSSPEYTGPITVSSSESITAMAVVAGYMNSASVNAAFTIHSTAPPPPTQAPMPDMSPNGGAFTTVQSVTITDSLAGASIYYTTDGSTPTTGSPMYTGPITVSSSQTIEAIATAPGYANSPVASASFVIQLPAVASFGAGLQMISLPDGYAGISLDTLFGYAGVKLAVWDPVGNAYAITPTAPANEITLGQAYWVRFPQTITVTLTGTPAPTGAPFDIPLQPGWNMIGDPFTTAVPLSSLTFNHGAMSFSQATTGSNPLIGATIWSYDTGSNAYASAMSLASDAGYWVYAYRATDVDMQ